MDTTLPGVYLAGGAYTSWRDDVIDQLNGFATCYDPIAMSRQNAMVDFTHDDLEALRASKYMLLVQDYAQQHGAALEAGFAYALDIPFLYVCLVPRIESMTVSCAKAAFTDIDTAVEYMKKRMLS